MLEEELGTQLLVRHKGRRTIELTASGRDLIPLADIRKNLYIPCGYLYRQWHEYWWRNTHSYIWVDPVSTAANIFHEDGMWTVVPESVAALLLQQPGVCEIKLSSMPTSRMTYYIISRNPREKFRIVQSQVRDILQQISNQTYQQ